MKHELERTGGANAAIARRQIEQDVDREFGVLIVRGDFLGDFPFVSSVGAWAVVRERFWAGEFVVRGWGRDYVALRRDLTCEARNRAGYWMG